MPAQHKKLSTVAQFYAECDTRKIGLIQIGDSRNDWRKWRGLGFFRTANLRFAALICQGGVQSNNGSDDGLGNLPLLPTGMVQNSALPGSTLGGSTFVNRYPGRIGETWVTGATSNPHFSRFNIVYSTAGFDMDSSGAGGTGGQFFRGDPLLGRNVTSIESFFVVDNRAGIWLGGGVDFGFSANESNGGSTTFGALTAGDPDGTIRTVTLTPTPATGTNIRVRQRHTDAAPATGRGHILAATKINFGTTGIVYDNWSYSGQSISDFLGQNPPESIHANTDWKFLDAKASDWYSAIVGCSKAIVRIELGQNSSANANYDEWNGVNTGNYKRNMEWLIARVVSILGAAGVTDLCVELAAPWRGTGDDVNRINLMETDLKAIVDTYPLTGILKCVAYYDQQKALEDASHCTGVELKASLREDTVHQNFDGMVALGQTYWSAITKAGGNRSQRVSPNSIGIRI